jgi:hypothetical protein
VSHFVETLKDDIVTIDGQDLPPPLQDAETAWYRDFVGVWKGKPELYLKDALPLFEVRSARTSILKESRSAI